MNAEEQRLIEDLFERLRGFDRDGGKDPEAEGLIRDLIRRSPDAPYYLAQTVIVQQQALERAEARMRELEDAASRPPQYTGRGGSFLPGSSGSSVPTAGGDRYAGVSGQPIRGRDAANAPSASPWSSQPQPSGGGFLSSALTTAAGVAGGVFFADGIRSLFGGGSRESAIGSNSDQAALDRAQDEAQDARDDADKAQKDLASDDAELDAMQDANDDDPDDTWTDDDSMDV